MKRWVWQFGLLATVGCGGKAVVDGEPSPADDGEPSVTICEEVPGDFCRPAPLGNDVRSLVTSFGCAGRWRDDGRCIAVSVTRDLETSLSLVADAVAQFNGIVTCNLPCLGAPVVSSVAPAIGEHRIHIESSDVDTTSTFCEDSGALQGVVAGSGDETVSAFLHALGHGFGLADTSSVATVMNIFEAPSTVMPADVAALCAIYR